MAVGEDPVIQAQRARIAALDQQILRAMNQRVELVRQLKTHKAAQGLPFEDAEQEARLLARLAEANPGPLPEAGLREIFGLILRWVKRAAQG